MKTTYDTILIPNQISYVSKEIEEEEDKSKTSVRETSEIASEEDAYRACYARHVRFKGDTSARR